MWGPRCRGQTWQVQYHYLFTAIRIGQTIIPNRIVLAAHLTNLAENNLPGPRLIAYSTERAKGGCGLIITEEQSVLPSDWAYQKLIHGFDPHVLQGKVQQLYHLDRLIITTRSNTLPIR